MKIETRAFHDLIVLLNKAHYVYNKGNIKGSIYALAQVIEGIETLIHHLKNKENSHGRN